MPEFDPHSVQDNPAEQKVLHAVALGEWAKFSAGEPRTIRATFLRHLLLRLPVGDSASWPLSLPGVRIDGAIIEGTLDLTDCTGPEGASLPVLALEKCDIGETMDLTNARIARLSIAGSSFGQINAVHARIDGPFDFSDTKQIKDTAWIDANGLSVGGTVNGYRAVLCRASAGPDEPRDNVLSLQNAVVTGSLDLRNLSATGGVWLVGARITGSLLCASAKLRNPNGNALVLGSVDIGGAVHLYDGFEAEGRVSLIGARITGNLECGGAKLRNPNGDALMATNACIGGDLSLDDGFGVEGHINLYATRVTGDCTIRDATFCNPTGDAIVATSLEVGDDLTLQRSTVLGHVILRRAKIGASGTWQELRFPAETELDGKPQNYPMKPDIDFDLSHVRIEGALHAHQLETDVILRLNLEGTSAATLDDKDVGCWGNTETTTLNLDGFIYNRLALGDGDTFDGGELVKKCRLWLGQQRPSRPQPYRQLAKVLRLQGHPTEARRITIAENDERRIADNRVFRVLWRFWGYGFGYGLAPGRAAATLLFFTVIGYDGTWFANDYAKVMVLSATNTTGWSRPGPDGPQPVFGPVSSGVTYVELPCGNQINHFFYAVDVMLPVVPLHQESKCEISTEPDLHKDQWLEGWRIAKSLFSIIGKLITTLALITFSGILRPRDEV